MQHNNTLCTTPSLLQSLHPHTQNCQTSVSKSINFSTLPLYPLYSTLGETGLSICANLVVSTNKTGNFVEMFKLAQYLKDISGGFHIVPCTGDDLLTTLQYNILTVIVIDRTIIPAIMNAFAG